MISAEFQYVVERKEQDRICFLSGLERGLDVLKKEKFATKPYNLNATSAMYRTLNKVRSTRGVGGLASLSPRFEKMRLEQIPGPNRYNLMDRKQVQPSTKPFGSGALPSKIISNTPGPGTYRVTKKCWRTRMLHTFGGRMRMEPTVEVKCEAKALDTCDFCHTTCTGDYWHLNYTIFLCLRCMRAESRTFTTFTRAEINEFKKIRNCFFMHQHNGTTAAVRLLPKHAACMKFRKENYLDLFFDKYI